MRAALDRHFPTFLRLRLWLEDHTYLLVALAILAALLYVAWYAAGVEAATYNRFTGADVTQREALFTNLRLDCF
jgi:hypothetical protein